MKCKIVIADDHPIFRMGIKEIITGMADAVVSGEASDGLDAYKLIVSTIPEIAILDVDMPILTGLDVCRKVLAEKHFTRFIILTMHKDRHFFEDAMNNGVDGYLLKDNAVDELVKCIESVRQGRKYVSPQIEKFLIDHQAMNQLPAKVQEMYATLTPTEKVILKLIARNKTSHDIAENLFISANTVDNHRANIARKFKLEGKNSLMKFALAYKELL